MSTKQPWQLTAAEALPLLKDGSLTVEAYARSLLDRIQRRDQQVKAWVYLSPSLILSSAKALDSLPPASRGPLHGLPIAVKDVILTRDMPTQYNSPLFQSSVPINADANVIMSLRAMGALIFGKTATTEFACSKRGGWWQNLTKNCHAEGRTPGGSSSGSGAAVGDWQVPVALGTQTGGSVVRPASFGGCFGFKPTWGAISREGLGQWSMTLDTCGFFTRSIDDLEILCSALRITDDVPPSTNTPFSLQGAKIGFLKSPYWPNAGPGTQKAWTKAQAILKTHGAEISDVDSPAGFEKVLDWHADILTGEGQTSFLGHHYLAQHLSQTDPNQVLGPDILRHLNNDRGVTHASLLAAYDNMARLRPIWDSLAAQYDIVLTPSVVDEAPEGLEYTGDMNFCSPWTVLHAPVVNLPGFAGENGLPIGLTAVGGRYRDCHLLWAAKSVGEVFGREGGWVVAKNL